MGEGQKTGWKAKEWRLLNGGWESPYTRVVLLAICLTAVFLSLINLKLFQLGTEFFTIISAFGIFILSMNFKKQKFYYIGFIGASYAFVGAFNLFHLLAFRELNIFPADNGNIAEQVRIAGGYVESAALLAACTTFYATVRRNVFLHFYSIASTLLFSSIFLWNVFPRCITRGGEVTRFAKFSEYIMVGIILMAHSLLAQNKKKLDRKVYGTISLFIAFKAVSHIMSTFSADFLFMYIGGRVLELAALYLMYRAVVAEFAKSLARYRLLRWDGVKHKFKARLHELIRVNNSLKQQVEEHKRAEEAIRYQAFHDSLTGLYNRNFFDEEMIRIGRDMSRYKPLSIISIDVDGLKVINDTIGHKAGDELLYSAASIIKKPFRSIDVIARTGGDEFCIILPGVSQKAAKERKAQIIKAVHEFNSQERLAPGRTQIPLSMSIGIASSTDNGNESIYDIYQKADDNMYQYKLTHSGSQKSKVVDMLLTALSERDYIAYGHVERLSNMLEVISDKMEIPDDVRDNLILLAKIHDVGKIGIPDEILFKPGRLSDEESAKMKEHTKLGYNIASRSRELSHIAEFVLHHHEFWDGTGYPDGLKGEEIPFECRMLNIADAYDVMTSTRPYHDGISREQAIIELEKCSGTQFDPVLTKKFIQIIKEID